MALSYADVQSFSKTLKALVNAATTEFLDTLPQGASQQDVMELATALGHKYRILGSELGAQWYDYCARMAGVDVDPAYLLDTDVDEVSRYVDSFIDLTKDVADQVGQLFHQLVNDSVRDTGRSNMWRDYGRGIRGGRWARIPVGDKTCAFCIMLASNGAWYLTEESALGVDPDHYHAHCDCIAAYYANPEEMDGYTAQLADYKKMYYDAENTRLAGDLPEDLQERVNAAREAHSQNSKNPWTKYNETLVIMRSQNGLRS